MMYFALGIFWFVRTTKSALFWLYLWQLKEYHIGRFLDHFRTAKGQYIFLNWLFGAKVALLAGFIFYPIFLAPLVLAFYIFEAAKAIFDFGRGAVKRPVFTSKTGLLAGLSLGIVVLAPLVLYVLFRNALQSFIFGLLIFDIFAPVVVSIVVLIFQPFAVLGRRRIIGQAIKKRAVFVNLTVIGITGSYGKTSTKEFLALILGERFRVLKTKAHQNSEIGVAQCVLSDLKPEHEIFIVEMGAYGRGGIKLLCDIVKPKIGILTGINEQHMATFGSQENIIKTKFELVEALPNDGVAVVNWDNQFVGLGIKNYELRRKGVKIVKYSVHQKENVWVDDIRVERESVSFRAAAKDGDSAQFRVHVLGAHYVLNILAVVACAKELGMTMAEISAACDKITPDFAGMVLKKNTKGANVISATYSANPNGVMSHLEYLKVFSGKKVIIMPCLIELGKASKEVHRRIGQKIGEVCDFAIVVTKERFNDIKAGARAGAIKKENILFLEKPKDIFEKVKDFSGPDDVILLEGRLPKNLLELL